MKTSKELAQEQENKCTHGVTFDVEEAQRILGDWQAKDDVSFVLGNPAVCAEAVLMAMELDEVKATFAKYKDRLRPLLQAVTALYDAPDHAVQVAAIVEIMRFEHERRTHAT